MVSICLRTQIGLTAAASLFASNLPVVQVLNLHWSRNSSWSTPFICTGSVSLPVPGTWLAVVCLCWLLTTRLAYISAWPNRLHCRGEQIRGGISPLNSLPRREAMGLSWPYNERNVRCLPVQFSAISGWIASQLS